MKKGYVLTLSVIGIMFGILSMLAGSYALWSVTKIQTGNNSMSTGCFSISYSDTNSINLTNAFPMTDEEGALTDPYTFTIENTCTVAASYVANLENLSTTTLDAALVRTKIDTTTNTLSTLPTTTKSDSTSLASYTIATGVVNPGESVTHSLKIWIDNNATVTNATNKVFNAKVIIDAKATKTE